jgi:hypothetical protein
MEPIALGQGVQDLSFFSAIRESHYLYPVLLSTHLATLGLFGGLILVTNLRLLGLALVGIPIATLLDRLRRWKYLGLAVMVTTGGLIAGSKASEYLANPYFQAKLVMLTLVGIHGVMFRAAVYRNLSLGGAGPLTRTAGALSLVLWIAVLSLGRWIAYFD